MSDFIQSGLSPMAAVLKPSSILAIAGRVRELVDGGQEICNLTIGDFKPSEYPIPELLRDAQIAALNEGYTNYPPSNGIAELRAAIADFYKERLGWQIDPLQVTVASGARPLLYACYRAVVAPGDKVVYPVPSWNNNHYSKMLGANAVALQVGPDDNFFPRPDLWDEHLSDARLFALNSPLNPTGTCIDRAGLVGLCNKIVAENERRKAIGEKPLYLLYDQIYWLLTFGDVEHHDPVSAVPAMADYTIYVDGISKAFASTGLRLGWGVAPLPVAQAMNRLLGHVGAWAPHPCQQATVQLLHDNAAIDTYLAWIRTEASDRLTLLHDRLTVLGKRYPIRTLTPEGAIYLSVEFALRGYSAGGKRLDTPDDVRAWILDEAGTAVVPFTAFGAGHATDWYRLSVGAVSRDELRDAMDRIEAALDRLQPPMTAAAAAV